MYALVTGATSGIGLEIAKILAKDKYDLIIVGRRKDRLNKIKHEFEEKYNIKVVEYSCDLADINECNALIEFTKQYKDISVVINSAGFGKVGFISDVDIKDDIDMINTNITALHIITKYFSTIMEKGNIVNIASIAGTVPDPYMTTYGATKAYVISLGLALSYELKKQNKKDVHITTCCPGPVNTEFNDVAGAKFKLKGICAKKCASRIIKAMKKNKRMYMTDIVSRLAYYVSRIIPQSLLLFIEYNIQIKKTNN